MADSYERKYSVTDTISERLKVASGTDLPASTRAILAELIKRGLDATPVDSRYDHSG